MSVISTALSGLNVAERRLANNANNIANVTTPNFKPKDAVQSPVDTGGVRVDFQERNPATVTVNDGDGNAVELPNTSLDKELIDANIATYDYQANLQVIKKQKEMDKALLDIQA